jgi:hypothetical protein
MCTMGFGVDKSFRPGLFIFVKAFINSLNDQTICHNLIFSGLGMKLLMLVLDGFDQDIIRISYYGTLMETMGECVHGWSLRSG